MDTPARLLELLRSGDVLHVVLDAGGRTRQVDVDLTPRTQSALPFVFALLGHDHGRPGAGDLTVGVLLRSIAVLGGETAGLVVRASPQPAFWLRMLTADGPRELHLDVLDAFTLLLSRKLPIHVVDDPAQDWDAALTRLLDER